MPVTHEDIRATLERTNEIFQDTGWRAGGNRGSNGELCLLNTIGRATDELREERSAEGLTFSVWSGTPEIVELLAEVLTEENLCTCPCSSSPPVGRMWWIAHVNDIHCTGPEQARDIVTKSLKKLQEKA